MCMVKVTRSKGILIAVIIVCLLVAGCANTGTPPVTTTPPTPTPSTVPPSTTIPPTTPPTTTPQTSPSYYAVSGNFYPSGWMGDISDITLIPNSNQPGHSGDTSIQITYSPKSTSAQKWAGVYWQYPENNFGGNAGGRDLTGRKILTFW